MYGCEAAARRYYGKPCATLDENEAAGLVAMIPNPRRINPRVSAARHARAQRRVLWLMAHAGYLKNTRLGSEPPPPPEPVEEDDEPLPIEPEAAASPPDAIRSRFAGARAHAARDPAAFGNAAHHGAARHAHAGAPARPDDGPCAHLAVASEAMATTAREDADVETSSAGYAQRFAGGSARGSWSVQARTTLELLRPGRARACSTSAAGTASSRDRCFDAGTT